MSAEHLPHPDQPPEHPEAHPPRGQRILIVDDDSAVREMLSRVLAGEGYTVCSATNGADALRIIRAAQIDLVLLDLNMPGLGGWDTFERLTTQNPLLGVIVITARAGQSSLAEAAGVSALLEKPLHFPQLLQSIRAVLAESTDQRLARLAGRSKASLPQAP